MKRTFLDITQKISRDPQRTILTALNLNDAQYSIWEAKGWRFVGMLREIKLRETQDRLRLYINTQFISAKDYIVEESQYGLIIRFIKDNFQYSLDEFDTIEIIGDIEKYS